MKSKFVLIVVVIFILVFSGIFCLKFYTNYNDNIEKENFIKNDSLNIIDNEVKNDFIEDNEGNLSTVIEEQPVILEDLHVNINVIGDIMCHNSQFFDAYNNSTREYDFSYVFDDVKEATSNTDIFIGNLETTFAGKERGYSNYPNFNSPEQLAYDLKELGIDILTTANNHCMDTGYSGLESTLEFLDEAEILHTGTNRSVEEQNKILIKEVNGMKIAFLSFTYGTNGIPIPKDKEYAVNLINDDFIMSQLELAKIENPDLICASMHWGIEYQTIQNSEQERLADLLISNGVDIIFGSHPHVLQPMEYREVKLDNGNIRKGFVIYSLGNFMSGQTQKGTRTSIILNLDITKKVENQNIYVDNVSYIPIYTYKGTGSKKYKILNIEKAIEKYESGEDRSIGESNYSLFKTEYSRVKELLKL